MTCQQHNSSTLQTALTTYLSLHFLFDFSKFLLFLLCESFYKKGIQTMSYRKKKILDVMCQASHLLLRLLYAKPFIHIPVHSHLPPVYIHSPLASSRFKSLASTLLRRSIILGLGGLPGRRACPPFRPRTLRGFSLSGFGGRPRRPVMAMIIEGTSSLAKRTHFIPCNILGRIMSPQNVFYIFLTCL